MDTIISITVIVALVLIVPLVFRKLGLPSIVGLILAGVAIGPYGFGIVERSGTIDVLGQCGLYYIMFTSGIEIDINDFKRDKLKTLTFGSFTFSIPLIIGFAAAYWLLHFSISSSLLLAAMFGSHTLMTYPIVSRYGIQRNPAVGITIGGTMMAVTLSLLLIAGVASFERGEMTPVFWTRLIIFSAVFIVAVLWLMPKLAHWVFRRFNDSILQFTFVMLMIFVAVLLSESAGLEGILGAFLAGLALNRLIPNLSPLMNRISFVGNAIFIPVFLISVGMLVDLRAFIQGWDTLYVAAVMSIVALATKWLAALVTQKSCLYTADERRLIFGLSGAKAAVSLAAVMIGYNIITPEGAHLLSADVLNGTIVMILLTCTCSSIVTEHTSKYLALQQQPLLDTDAEINTKSQHSILLPLANPKNTPHLLDLAFLSADPKQAIGINALRVVKQSDLLPEAEDSLRHVVQIAASAERQISCYTQVAANVANGIAEVANRLESSEIIIGSNVTEVQLEDLNMMRDGKRLITYGNVISHLLTNQAIQISIYHPHQPVNTIKRLLVALPSASESEQGFMQIYQRIHQISRQLGCATHFYADIRTTQVLQTLGSRPKKEFPATYSELNDWEDFLLIAKEIEPNDMLIVVQARKGTATYKPLFEKMPYMLYRFFKDNSWLVLYPEQIGGTPAISELLYTT